MELFIKDLKIDDINGIENFLIPLGSDERKHLILTGKNGSGKTSTLNEINQLLMKLHNNQFKTLQNLSTNIKHMLKSIELEDTNIQNSKKYIENAIKRIENLKKTISDLKNLKLIDKEKNIKELNDEIIVQQNNINVFQQNINSHYKNKNNYNTNIDFYKKQIKDFSKININFKNQEYVYKSLNEGSFIMAFFEARRVHKPRVPNGVEKLNMQKKNSTTSNLSLQFIQYLVNLRMEMLDAMAENEEEEVNKINNWFNNFENSLKELFDNSVLKLKYKKKEFNYKIEYNNQSFGLNELSDGYSSVISIITELILRMEAHNVSSYNLQGVVLIDELETHLHVSLQKKILPFLTKFFPKIQFIITTHSPFILSSLSNVVICDLEKKIITEDLSAYSYESLVDSYFDINKYSDKVIQDLKLFKELVIKYKEKNITDQEKLDLVKLENYFDNLSFFGNEEIGVTLKQIKDMF